VLKGLRSAGREAAGAALYLTGAARAFELAARPTGAIILMYHSVAPEDAAQFIDPPNRLAPAMFERQMAFLRERRRVAPLAQVVEQIAAGESPPAGTVCITFDDGYLDNLTTAATILERYGLPATLFLATGHMESGEAPWADTLYRLLERRGTDRLALPCIGLDANLATPSARSVARARLHATLLEADSETRVRLLEELRAQLAPTEAPPPRLMMTWNEVRELCRRYPGIAIGGHTRDHIDLRTHRGATARRQIEACAQDLRRELGIMPEHFSFPYSRWCAETRDLVIACGWKSAVGVGEALRITAESDRFAMPRVEAPRAMPELGFKTSGAFPGALALLGLA
jgi:peptidoglycan/xylan/chitin deacetylase (PgdA/CDA1 family)